jgi:hypothetical protein
LTLSLTVTPMSNRILNKEEIDDVMDKLIDTIQTQIFQANAQRELDTFFAKIGYSYILENAVPSYAYVDIRNSRILVIAFDLNTHDLSLAAKKEGIDPNRIDFVEYSSHYDFGSLKHSQKYSDVLVGPIPHNVKNMGDASSFLAAVSGSPQDYPKVQRMESISGQLKVTKTAFIDCLIKSKLYQEINS